MLVNTANSRILPTILTPTSLEERELTYDTFLNKYTLYSSNTEIPAIFSRWCAIAAVGALLEKSVWINHGNFRIFPNEFIMLMGSPGTRKTTAIRTVEKFVQMCGYTEIAAEKSSKEKFLMDLAGMGDDGNVSTDFLEQQLFGDSDISSKVSPVFIMADEFNEFLGTGNLDFASTLGNFWDFDKTTPYRHRLKNSKSIEIPNPIVSILAGNTPDRFNKAFGTDFIGQGFFSRLIFVHAEKSKVKISFPVPRPQEETDEIFEFFKRIRALSFGQLTITKEASELLTFIYTNVDGPSDTRFEYYNTRRFTHLLKTCIICCCCRLSDTLDKRDVIEANTILSYTEHFMPRALGEFGKAKDSDITNKIISVLEEEARPLEIVEIWKAVQRDLDNIGKLSGLIQGLVTAQRVIVVNGGFLIQKEQKVELSKEVYDAAYLTSFEREKL